MRKSVISYEKPMPQKKIKGSKYPFALMKVGGSYWHPTTTQNLLTNFKLWCIRRSKNWEAQTEVEFQKGIKGARIWRVK